jgi:hypothetical protein
MYNEIEALSDFFEACPRMELSYDKDTVELSE